MGEHWENKFREDRVESIKLIFSTFSHGKALVDKSRCSLTVL